MGSGSEIVREFDLINEVVTVYRLRDQEEDSDASFSITHPARATGSPSCPCPYWPSAPLLEGRRRITGSSTAIWCRTPWPPWTRAVRETGADILGVTVMPGPQLEPRGAPLPRA